jgi:FkbH-like protein
VSTSLSWLPILQIERSGRAIAQALGKTPWPNAVALANHQLDFIRTNQLDNAIQQALDSRMPTDLAAKPVRLAILSSSTTAHLHAAVRVAGLRRNLHVTVYEVDYGQYWQELTDPDSALYHFGPTIILFALDPYHLAAGLTAGMSPLDAATAFDELQARLRECWRIAQEAFHCPVIQQTPLPVHPSLLGSNEHRLPGSKAAFIARLNASLRPMADAAGVDLLALDECALRDGISAWHDPVLWYRAKQEVSPSIAPLYGDLVMRIVAAKLGRSYKALVLDLDNTLWGGVIGDDGLEGIVLGQGSALGEAFIGFQSYARELSRRGVILAVCSKNDAANAIEPFDKHPEMLLKQADIASFVANWSDKAANIRAIASHLNIGLDSLVFVDDNPFERSLVRQELPMVAVPEVGDDPATFAQTIADAGYFEGLTITQEDRERSGQYQGNQLREALKASATDLPSYLRSLDMALIWRRFDKIGLSRTTQLINKTNQFNLTTRRYSDDDVAAIVQDARAFGLQLRLVDRFGDNGIISVVIGKMQDNDDLMIDTWLMSCRVLGRQVEPTTLNLVVSEAQRLGARRLIGEYIATKKNGMVRDHYARLGFEMVEDSEAGSRAVLDLTSYGPAETFIVVREG